MYTIGAISDGASLLEAELRAAIEAVAGERSIEPMSRGSDGNIAPRLSLPPSVPCIDLPCGGVPAPCRENICELSAMSLAEAIHLLPIEFLWRHFDFPGEPATNCSSPFREDRNPSFSIFMGQDGKSRFKDFGDPDSQGDSFDFFQRCMNMTASEAFGPFCELAIKVRRGEIKLPESSGLIGGRAAAGNRPLSDRERAEMQKVAKSLQDKTVFITRIATAGGWQPETIAELAREGSLGWHDRSIAFIYETGVKLRYLSTQLDRHIYWLFGNGSILWRRNMLTLATTVFVMEGETDAITAIDAGFETSPGIAVVAVPSASCLCPDSAPLFAGKEVILCLDADKAGEQATAKMGSLLKPFAKRIQRLDLKEALK